MKKETPHFFEQLVETNKSKIYRICQIYAVSPVEPQDLFQEVIFQVWKSLPQFKQKSSIHTWVYRITLNVCLRSKLKFDNDKTTRLEAVQITSANPTEDDGNLKILRECIATLDDTDTSIILLYLEEMAYKEISQITGLTENHIAVKMKRIKRRLLECMQPKL